MDFYQTHSTINYKKISASKWTKLTYVLLTGTLNISLQNGAFNLKSTSIGWNPSFETPLSGGNVKSLVTNYNPEKSTISRRRKLPYNYRIVTQVTYIVNLSFTIPVRAVPWIKVSLCMRARNNVIKERPKTSMRDARAWHSRSLINISKTNTFEKLKP